MKLECHGEIHTPMFIAAILLTGKMWSELRCPSMVIGGRKFTDAQMKIIKA